MAYLVLARKYRPQSFGEMAGQEHVVRTLSNALRTGHLAHAFLFTGPRGVGKTTAARLVAKCLNCERGPTAEPCGACAPCVEIAEGRAVDVVEIDAASNNGVDNVRDIVEGVKYRPARDRFKVFVVDEVHMLSTGAFNALLKTLEEPPAHVVFVLATTDVHKVPETILSRCQRFDFRRLTQQQIVDQLRRVARAEGLAVSDGALSLVARAAEGGMRDALSMLDQVRAACGDAPDDAAVAEAVGAIDPGAVARIAAALIRRDGAAVLAELAALHARGQEMKRIAEELVRHLRNVVVAKLVPQTDLDLPDVEVREVRAQADAAAAAQLTRLFDLAQLAATDLKTSEQPRYALEVALLKACFLAPGAGVDELIARLEGMGGSGSPQQASGLRPRASGAPSARGAGGKPLSGGTPGCAGGAVTTTRQAAPAAPSPSTVTATSAPSGTTAGQPPFPRGNAPDRVERGQESPAGQPSHPRDRAPAQAEPGQGIADRWRALVAEVERSSSSPALLVNALKQAVVASMTDGEISLRLPPGLPFSTVEKRQQELVAIFARHLGRPVALTLAKGPPGDGGPDAPGGGGEARSLAEVEQAEREARSARVRAAAREHPNIQDAAKILEGDVTKIEEL